MSDVKRLENALRSVGAKDYQRKMACILMHINGIEDALEFLRVMQARRLTDIPLAPLDQDVEDKGFRSLTQAALDRARYDMNGHDTRLAKEAKAFFLTPWADSLYDFVCEK